MKIWHKNAPNEVDINHLCINTMISELNIIIVKFESSSVWAEMPITNKVIQPYGIMHGGASCVLAETVGSVGSHCCIDSEQFVAVGQHIETSHIKPAKSGTLKACAKALHIGSKTHIWLVEIFDEKNRLISHSKLTMAIIPKEQIQ